jgi:tetratricopeptide (TPR) repeat protein/TolB-like protein
MEQIQASEGNTMKKLFFYRIVLLSLLLISLSTPATAKTMSILVYPFENTGDKQYSWLSAGMTDTAINDLMGIKEVSVISNADRKKIMEETKFILSGLVAEETMVKVGKLTGANVIFTGSYMVSGKNIRVIARLINVETGKTESSAKLDGSLEKIFDLQDKVVITLLSETGKTNISDVNLVRIAETEKKKIEEKPRPKTTAYELYAKGLELQDTNPKEALAYFTKALDMDENYVNVLIQAGFSAGNTLSLFDKALGYLTRADNILKARNATNTTEYANLIGNIGVVYSSKGDLDRALKYYTESQQIEDKLGLQNSAGYVTLMMHFGIIYRLKGDLDRALKYYTDSQQIEDKLGLQNTAGYARLMGNIGVVYWLKGDLDHALKYYTDSQQILDRLGLQNTADYATLMMNIGLVYSSKGDLDRTLKYYTDSQQIRDKLGLQNTVGYANLMKNIGVDYFSKGDNDRALNYCTDSQQILDRLGLQNTADYTGLMMNIGNAYKSKGDLDRAQKYYMDSQKTMDRLRLQDTADYAGLLFNMGLLYEKQGDSGMAGRYYRSSFDSFVSARYIGPMKDNALRNAQRLGY